ncbi:hypothetical protein GSI_14248 [Ganoderma sinense ZZ0214-1]|uniref:Uncharacterized protein n=1 Tax=Ganoderma sinense ZZ0214-1 TaxID=1077348 RepID=A0A2G8RSL9_9APHY|nr:hypothetical protein GSI_14248 [Ganoderma sinense ZZ0214-1]
MAMPVGEPAIPIDEQVHGPTPGQSTSGIAGVDVFSGSELEAELVSAEQARVQQRQPGTDTPSGPQFERLFPNMEWNMPYTPSPLEGYPEGTSISSGAGSTPVRKERIPYAPGNDLGVSTAWGMEGMPAILMYAPERPLLSGAAGSTDSAAAPEHLMLCVVEDAFERAWVAPQGYWRSVF